MNFEVWGREIFIQMSWKPGLTRSNWGRRELCTSELTYAQTPPCSKKVKSSYPGHFRWGQRMELSFGSSGWILVSVRKSAWGLEDWRYWCTELRLEDSPRILQNEMEKSLEFATLVTAVDLICLWVRGIVWIKNEWVMIGSVKLIEAAFVSEPMKVPIAILWPQKGPPLNCELGVAPVTNWHSRQSEIIHQLMRLPPKALPIGSGLCTIWRQACSPPYPTVSSGIARDQVSPTASYCD